MTREEAFERVQNIFREVFDEDDLLINDATNSDTIEDWDSLNHINLVTAIEKDFNIKLTLQELISLKNVGEMIDIMLEKLR